MRVEPSAQAVLSEEGCSARVELWAQAERSVPVGLSARVERPGQAGPGSLMTVRPLADVLHYP